MFLNETTARWLRHRVGEERLVGLLAPAVIRKGLELNKAGPAFIDTFGSREFHGLVGFRKDCRRARQGSLPCQRRGTESGTVHGGIGGYRAESGQRQNARS